MLSIVFLDRLLSVIFHVVRTDEEEEEEKKKKDHPQTLYSSADFFITCCLIYLAFILTGDMPSKM
jgi:hypothetical protein